MSIVTDLLPFFEMAKNRPHMSPEANDAVSGRVQTFRAATKGVVEKTVIEFPQMFESQSSEVSDIGAQVLQANEIQSAKATPEQLRELAEMRARQALEAIL